MTHQEHCVMKKPNGFLGTYFDIDSVFRLERWVRITAWVTFAIYVIEAGITTFQSLYNTILGNFPFDWYFIISTLSRVIQGVVLFMVLYAVAKILTILLDIEENTRRAARTNNKVEL
jgi:hypothetical protein